MSDFASAGTQMLEVTGYTSLLVIKGSMQTRQHFTITAAPTPDRRVVAICRHSALGSHDLSILLAIKDSKQLHLHLTGVTVPADHMCLAMMDQPFQLAPVPIGEPYPPMQTCCLRNGGPAELQYSINTAPLQQLTSIYGYEVSCCCKCGAAASLHIKSSIGV